MSTNTEKTYLEMQISAIEEYLEEIRKGANNKEPFSKDFLLKNYWGDKIPNEPPRDSLEECELILLFLQLERKYYKDNKIHNMEEFVVYLHSLEGIF